jgi:hypothetical protein
VKALLLAWWSVLVTAGLATAAPGATPATPATSAPQTLTGVVIRKEWTKSHESWNAGGSEYYVLKVDGDALPPAWRNALEGVILRPSKRVPFARFADVVGKRVRCRGRFVTGVAEVVAENAMEQRPTSIPNPVAGQRDAPVRGSGFRVDAITLLK